MEYKYEHIEVVGERTIRVIGDEYVALHEAVIFAILTGGNITLHCRYPYDDVPTVFRSSDIIKRLAEIRENAYRKSLTESTEKARTDQSPSASDLSNTVSAEVVSATSKGVLQLVCRALYLPVRLVRACL